MEYNINEIKRFIEEFEEKRREEFTPFEIELQNFFGQLSLQASFDKEFFKNVANHLLVAAIQELNIPKWKKIQSNSDGCSVLPDDKNYIIQGEYYLCTSDLDNLPKES